MNENPEQPDRASGDQVEPTVSGRADLGPGRGEPVRSDAANSSGSDGGTQGSVAPRRGIRSLVVLLAVIVVVGLLLAFTEAPALAVLGAVLLFLVIFRVGWFFLQQFATPPPPPPDPGTLRKVKLTYRCPVCGAEVRMTSAATEDPEPPRHCMEEMELVTAEE